MNKKTLQITTGAAVIAIFTVMLLLNRQTGSLFEEFFMFLFPIPMVAYSVQYGWKSSLPVLFGMVFFSFLFGTVYTVFYAVSEGIIGLVFGSCLHRKVDTMKTLFAVMFLSVIANVFDLVVLAGLFGMSLKEQVAEMQGMMDDVFAQAGVALPGNILTENYLMQIMIVSMIIMGILQGIVIYALSLAVLRRLRFQVQKPKSVYLYFPPAWTGFLALLLFFFYIVSFGRPLGNEIVQNILQAAGICGGFYLIVFGMVAVMLFVRIHMSGAKILGILICVIGYFMFSQFFVFFGFFYLVTSWHRSAVEQYFGYKG